ncbi:MAG TPA: sugar kinase [Xanthomonadales bacterium]|nr:sugar kinase [Xanthomonadales bacterium]
MSARVVCFGELLLRLGAPGRQLLLQSPLFDVHFGGAEANVAVSLAQFGHAAAMVSTVPQGPLGAAAAGELRRHGVDSRDVGTGAGRMGLYYLINGAIHRPSEVLYDRAGSAFALADPRIYDWDALLAGADWLHLSGVTPALGKAAADAAQQAAEAATRLGVRLSFDGNYRSKLWEAWDGQPAQRLRALLAHCEVLFASDRDIGVILGDVAHPEDPAERIAAAAARAFAAFPRLQSMATTLRTQRSVDHHVLSAVLVERSGAQHSTPEYEVTPIVDRIGTGDAFAAGVLHGLISGLGTAQALHFGLGAACLKHSIPGDFNRVGIGDVEAFVADRGFHVRR